MATPRTYVNPPVAQRPPYGLLDVATVINDASDHWQTSIEYNTLNCNTSKTWGDWCVGTDTPPVETVTRIVTITVSGTADPYTTIITAQVDGGADRQLRATVNSTTSNPTTTYTTTGVTDLTVHTQAEPTVGSITITDILTGTSGTFLLTQLADGTIQQPNQPIDIAIDEPIATEECPLHTITYTLTPVGDGYTVSVATTTTGETPRGIEITVGQATIVTDIPSTVEFTEVAAGFVRIAARDIASSAYTSGWMYLGEGSGDAVTLLVSACAAKEGQPPWITLSEDPFTIYGGVECRTIGFDQSDAVSSARRTLELSRGREIERVYWSRLVDEARDVVVGGVDVVRALAELEQYIAGAYVGVGVIHTSPFGVAYLASAGLLDATASGDERLRTWRGTPVVVGAGYSRSGDFSSPVGGADFWMFVTGSVVVRLSDVFVRQALDKASNVLTVLAEQSVVVADDCLVPGRVHVVPGGA